MIERKTILYVDDELLNLKLFRLHFSKNFTVLTAETGMEGLDILKLNPNISYVISDLKMISMYGLDFIRLAKVDHPNTKFYITSGNDMNKEIIDALNQKLIVNYFRKPYSIKEIEAALEK